MAVKVYQSADVTIRGPSDIDPDAWYGKGCFAAFSFHRGRIMQEALLRDPMAPKGSPHPRVPSWTVYRGQDILDYIASYSDDALPVQVELERMRRDDSVRIEREISALRKQICEQHQQEIQRLGDTRKAILASVMNILSSAVDVTAQANLSCGVYFLKKGDEIVYVGQSIAVFSRVQQHKSRKDFDSVTVLPCAPDQLNNLEGFFIRLLKPKLNGHDERAKINGAPHSWLWAEVVELDPTLVTA